MLLEDRISADGQSLLFANPVDIIRAEQADDLAGAFQQIDAALASGLFLAGWCSYELGYAFEPRLRDLMPKARRAPLLWFGCFEAAQRLDPASLDAFWAEQRPPKPLSALSFAWDREVYAKRVRRVLDYLRAGDVYQVNLTCPVSFRFDGDPLELYAALRAAQPAAHGGIVATGDLSLLSVSPELFVETRGEAATTRPMKGTAARGALPDADIEAARALQSDPKQRAENLMIVDLLRNDLSRISEIGSVEVPELFTVETYPTLHTLTSTVTSRLKPGVTAPDLIRAMFPCGSVTGAPKIRAMEIIRELEDVPRGAYTGSIGMIAPSHDLRFNVAIRTATLYPDGEGVYGVGGGIVADSEPVAEYEECKLKARVLTGLAEEFGLIETLRWSCTEGYQRLGLHLDRLAHSARHLGFTLDEAAIGQQLEALAQSFGAGADQRVRIELRRSGEIALSRSPLSSAPDGPMAVAVARQRVDAGDPFLRHKTTKRHIHEAALAEAQAAGADEAMFLNRAGFITETTRGSIFVEAGGRLLTPALRHGLLPGVLRRHLLEAGRAVEADLRSEDIARAERWFVGSSLRGLREACFAGAA